MNRTFQRTYLKGRQWTPKFVRDRLDTFSKSCEKHLIRAIQNNVIRTDDCVLVGGGYGLSTLYTAERANSVIAYEPNEIGYNEITANVNRHGLDNVDLRHGLVGPDYDVWGPYDTAERIEPAELPAGDVLILDCEGAEIEILDSVGERYEKLIVEFHPSIVPYQGIERDLINEGFEQNTYHPGNCPVVVYRQ